MSDLNEKQKKFCELYIENWNGTQAYQKVYNCKESTAGANASKLLSNTNVKDYIKQISKDLEKTAGISKLAILKRLIKVTENTDFENTGYVLKSIDTISKLLGYFEPDKVENKENVNISLDKESIKRMNDVLENDY